MHKLLYTLAVTVGLCCIMAATACLTSCSNTYEVRGSSSISTLDGSKLYLKAIKNNELKKIDSCDVIHGQFEFSGVLDTVRMATLFMDEQSILPIVLEDGDITIKIDNINQHVSGSPLNDILYEFLGKHKQLNNRHSELVHKHSQMLLDGMDEMEANQRIAAESAQIAKEVDQLIMDYISDNFDNVLGPGIFMMITNGYQYPILTPQIEHIMSKATEKFKNDPYVKDYYQTATENEERMLESGMPAEPQADSTSVK